MNVLVEAGRLAAEGTPFALATVVGVERPSSARVGDRALVTGDGELHGWVGGACTEPEVVRLALAALADGDVRRERIESRCASEGAVEVRLCQAVFGQPGARVICRALAHGAGPPLRRFLRFGFDRGLATSIGDSFCRGICTGRHRRLRNFGQIEHVGDV